MSNPIPATLGLTTVADGSSIVASDHRNNYAAIQAAVNELIAALSSGNAGDVLTSAGASAVQWGGGVPTGALLEYGAAAAPTGWLLCDGSAISRATYATLFGVVGTTYGVGDGSTTFNLPDLRGRVAVGYAASGGHTDVSTLGANDGVSAANRRAKHRHTPHSHSGGAAAPVGALSGGGGTVIVSQAATGTADGGSGNASDSLDAPAYIVVNRIIKT